MYRLIPVFLISVNSDDALICKEKCQENYLSCIEQCSGNTDCSLICNRDYVNCEENCSNEKISEISFLVFNSYYAYEASLFTWTEYAPDVRQEKWKNFYDFYGPGTSADESCSLVYKNTMYIFCVI